MPYADKIRYLGLYLTRSWTWHAHQAEMSRKIARRTNTLRFLAGVSWGSHPALLLKLYASTIRPLLEYGAGIVHLHAVKLRDKAQALCSAGIRPAPAS